MAIRNSFSNSASSVILSVSAADLSGPGSAGWYTPPDSCRSEPQRFRLLRHLALEDRTRLGPRPWTRTTRGDA